MRNFKLILLTIGVALTIASCTKNNGGTSAPNNYGTFTYNDTSYAFRSAYAEKYEKDTAISQATNIDLVFFSDGLSVIYNEGISDSVYGTGVSFYLEAYSANENSFSEGVYVFDDSGIFPANSFTSHSDISVGNFTTSQLNFIDITGGTFTVTKNGLIYKLVFDLQLKNGKKITGTYTGAINIK